MYLPMQEILLVVRVHSKIASVNYIFNYITISFNFQCTMSSSTEKSPEETQP